MISDSLWQKATRPNLGNETCVGTSDNHSMSTVFGLAMQFSFGTKNRGSFFMKCTSIWPWNHVTLTYKVISDLRILGQHSFIMSCSFKLGSSAGLRTVPEGEVLRIWLWQNLMLTGIRNQKSKWMIWMPWRWHHWGNQIAGIMVPCSSLTVSTFTENAEMVAVS